jgi:hypothetical protein
MKKTCSFILLLIVSSFQVFSQTTEIDTSWKTGGFFGLNFNQVALSNWEQGGDNSVALSSTANLFANYVKGKVEWSNSLDMAYAMVQTGDDNLKKSDDKIDLTSKYSRKFAKHWLYSGLFNFKSQFAYGYKYPDDSTIVSKFLAPGYFTLSLGITYKPVDYFEVLISPATAKMTLINDNNLSDAGAYGVDPGETIRTEFGAYLNAKFQKDIMENVNFLSKLELFNNYTDPNKDNVSNIDVNWENILNMKVNKMITASITFQLIYDADVIEKTQYKESLGIGFGYKF